MQIVYSLSLLRSLERIPGPWLLLPGSQLSGRSSLPDQTEEERRRNVNNKETNKDEIRDDLQSEETLISPGMFLTDYLSDRKVFILINIFHTLYFIIMHSSHQS